MMPFEQLSPSFQVLLTLWSLLLLLYLSFLLMRLVQQRRRFGFLALAAAPIPADYALLQFLTHALQTGSSDVSGRGLFLFSPLLLSLLVLLTVIAVLLRLSIGRWHRTHITPMSVRESMDGLPAGLCYFLPGGLLKLKNDRMDLLCRAVTGGALQDGEAFWGALRDGEPAPGTTRIRAGDNPILRLGDGTVYSFRRRDLTLEGHPIHELTALDVTEEFAVSLELKEKQARADLVNRRLRALNGTITALTIEKETLAAKTRLHDEFGRALLTAKRYLYVPESVDREALLSLWRQLTFLLKDTGPNALQEEYIDVVRSAWLLGVDISVDGALPEQSPARDLAVQAISTCLTNTLRHAQGTHMYVRCGSAPGACRMEIMNDGNQPEGPITEGGGLGDLRRAIEGAGGTMEVAVRPRFLLTLTIPKEGIADDERTHR